MCKELTQTNAERSNLHFPEEVQTHFNYLVVKHGFRCVIVEATLVRYESDCIFVNIYHGKSSCEIGLEIGKLVPVDKIQGVYNISWLIQLDSPKKAADYQLFVATNPGLVKKGVFQLCKLFKRYAGKALLADESTFSLLSKLRDDWKEAFAKEVLVSQLRPKANDAFRRKNYDEVIRFYESIRSELTPAEEKKLAYAKKQQKSIKEN